MAVSTTTTSSQAEVCFALMRSRGSTQWELPFQDAAVCAGWRLFQAEDGGDGV